MPWDCKQCGALVEEDGVQACPGCAHAKTAWTIGDRTRTLRVGKRRLEPLRSSSTCRPRDPGGYDAVPWAPTDRAPALPKAQVRALAEREQLPAPGELLVVRVRGARALHVAVNHAHRDVEEHDLALEAPAGAAHADARLLCVFGEGPAPAFPGLVVLDVTDGAGHAPALEVSVPGRARREVRLEQPSAACPVIAALNAPGAAAGEVLSAARGCGRCPAHPEAPRAFVVTLKVDPANPASGDDLFTLRSHDGEVALERGVRDDGVPGDAALTVCFGLLPPGKRYTLEHRLSPDARPRLLFRDRPHEALVTPPPPRQRRPRPAPAAEPAPPRPRRRAAALEDTP